MDFYDLDLSDNTLDALDDMNFSVCTPIQEKCIPEILNGRDILGVAQSVSADSDAGTDILMRDEPTGILWESEDVCTQHDEKPTGILLGDATDILPDAGESTAMLAGKIYKKEIKPEETK